MARKKKAQAVRRELRPKYGAAIPGYCYNIEVGDIQDCSKVLDRHCTVYLDPCRKFGRAQMLGCAFSPLEAYVPKATFIRVGQQKQKKRRR